MDTPEAPVVLVTRRELAQRLGVHMQTICKWEREGMPIADRGRRGKSTLYSEPDVQSWRRLRDQHSHQAPDFMLARARKELAQAIEAEQRVAIRAKTLLHVDEVERTWSAQVAAIRARLLALPAALAGRVTREATLSGPAAVEALLQDAIHQALTELSGRKRSRKTRGTRA